MKILVIGPKLPYYFESACAQGFARLGCEVLQVDNKPPRWWLANANWFNLPCGLKIIQDVAASLEVYKAAKQWKPDVVFFCKAENIRAEVFTLLKNELKCKIVAWYVDNPFNASVSSFQSLRHIQKTDFCFIWAKYLVDTLISAGCGKAHFLPFAFVPELYNDNVILTPQEEKLFKCDVSFVGTWDLERERHLTTLVNKGFDLGIFGQRWTRVRPDSPLKPFIRSDAIWMTDVIKIFKASRLNLNFLRRHNWKGHNFRTMEITGAGGGALLTPWTEDQASLLFTDKRELLCFPNECPTPDWIKSILAQENYLKEVSLAGKRKVFQDHLLSFRLQEILNVLLCG